MQPIARRWPNAKAVKGQFGTFGSLPTPPFDVIAFGAAAGQPLGVTRVSRFLGLAEVLLIGVMITQVPHHCSTLSLIFIPSSSMTAILIASCTLVALAGNLPAVEQPNVMLIFADDVGYGDLGCYAATKVQTPNIDRLAKEGRRFTDAHSASADCTPSRYALRTGEYPFCQGTKGAWGPLSHRSGLIVDTNKATLNNVFKNAGYQTACVGKSHLGFGTTPCDWNKDKHEKRFFLYFPTLNIHHPLTPAKRFQGTSQCGRYGDITPARKLRKGAPQEQLYDLRSDPAQQTNVIRDNTERAEKMRGRLQEIRPGKATRPVPEPVAIHQPVSATNDTERVPNFVVIFTDDLGYGDISCYGASKIKTPNIDRLAREGMMFTDAHTSASVCSPSRYGLLTGRSPWRLHRKGNGYKLEPGRMTLASLVKAQGYRSAAIGKWHLGYGREWESPLSPGPLEAGFDYHFGVPTNHNDQYRAFVENHDFVGLKPGESLRVVKGQQYPSGLAEPRSEDQVDTTLTGKAVGFIRDNAGCPFFLYCTPCAPHTHVTPAAPFRGTSQAGLFGDHIQELDAHVGEILNTLDELQLTDHTFVIFSSDNGSTPKDFKGTQGVELNLADESGGIRENFKTAKRDAKRWVTSPTSRGKTAKVLPTGADIAFHSSCVGRVGLRLPHHPPTLFA